MTIAPRATEITIEISAGKNRDVYFRPAQRTLRGTVDVGVPPGFVVPEHVTALNNVPNIPGLYVSLDIQARRARVYDPLEFDTGLAAKVNAWCRNVVGAVGNEVYSPVPEQVYDLNDGDVASWCYWMKRTVDAGQAKLVAGSGFPAEKDWPKGDVRMDYENTNPLAPKYASEMEHLARTGVPGIKPSKLNPYSRRLVETQEVTG